jgi:hypothetical protein
MGDMEATRTSFAAFVQYPRTYEGECRPEEKENGHVNVLLGGMVEVLGI